MKILIITGLFLFFFMRFYAQELHQSIHAGQQEYYNNFGKRNASFYDSISGFSGRITIPDKSDCTLQKMVFGFHPFWAGSDYLNYQWNLLTDFCYFSYEVDPSTGDPVSYHDWLTDPAIDSARTNGVKVHLCATLFSGHSNFFINLTSRQNLINNLVSLVQQRNADGVNMDIEAVPGYLRDSVTAFMHGLSVQLKSAVPGAKISLELPAVDWGGSFDIDQLDLYVDYFFVMAYDYYWNGSEVAGPVSPLYSMTADYDYSLCRSVSTLETNGVSRDKFILGIPYYGRQWKTESNAIPSHKLANGTALTYANVRNNSSTYNSSVYYWEPNSFSSCYIFFQNDNWNQCFIGLDRDLRKKYDIVNYRKLAGTGIWALGYDNGYPELWQAISDKFSDCYIPLTYDTVYDSGGPAWNYYNEEDYIMTIDQGFSDVRWLSFINLNLEEGYDSLWLYAGRDTAAPFLGEFSGNSGPANFSSPNGAFTLKFRSDALNNSPGWMAVYHDGSYGVDDQKNKLKDCLRIYPNPAKEKVDVMIPGGFGSGMLIINDLSGQIIQRQEIYSGLVQEIITIDVADLLPGIYSLRFTGDNGLVTGKLMVKMK